ncbi:MAG: heavy-metal-associated domain-containing protein [Gammaproteobacteria bacterium]|nr:heavy-metal-associated domain-containing protein [Gammaproteobacteria bacterium]
MQQKFFVQNVKCGGCATAIKQALMSLPGVTKVGVDVPAGSVVVEGESLGAAVLTDKLQASGYPVN